MRRSLVLVALAATSMVALAFLIPLALLVRELAEDRALAEAQRQANALTPALVITTDPNAIRQAVVSTRYGGEQRLAVHLPDKGTLGSSRINKDQLAAARKVARAATLKLPDGVVYLQPVALNLGRVAIVEAYVPSAELTRGVTTTWWALGGVAIGLVAVSVFVADRMGARAVRAATALAEGAQAMGRGDLAARVEPSGPPELKAVGGAFNAMAERVHHLVTAEREVVADLSHRLRTPLTALLLDAETLGDGSGAERIRQAVRGLEREVDEIIRTARTGLSNRDGAASDATEVVRDRLVFWSALADDQERPWTVRGTDRPAYVPLPRTDLTTALDALLGNVFRHTPEGTRFAVTLFHQADMVALVVEDAGPGIENSEVAVRRGASGGGSTGLGLDIARRAAESTGGSLRVDRGPLGGARVQLRLRRTLPARV
ncbi:two-component sensor histidine kinase [Lentzea sp. NBRC 105346]|uniref:HAMP domain-containing sensor histidine kinase n=1 Tax=Lentzea sp. NBRC 105346 TaxID=3032205 RepID=UPI0024A15F5B|nr:HAMP domain-containing sensor histidine kinase [Lentzea sp. NBRC 105346]GLZ33817.1 two-component sensor histidine kinase [Lentzea sp. NBRC 105346]